MRYKVVIKRKAQKQLNKIRREDRERIIGTVFGLAEDPTPRNSRELQGRVGRHLRMGDYRVIYEVDEEEREITILQVGHRRDVYR
jgi:mRNA interferase RelE/StbE